MDPPTDPATSTSTSSSSYWRYLNPVYWLRAPAALLPWSALSECLNEEEDTEDSVDETWYTPSEDPVLPLTAAQMSSQNPNPSSVTQPKSLSDGTGWQPPDFRGKLTSDDSSFEIYEEDSDYEYGSDSDFITTDSDNEGEAEDDDDDDDDEEEEEGKEEADAASKNTDHDVRSKSPERSAVPGASTDPKVNGPISNSQTGAVPKSTNLQNKNNNKTCDESNNKLPFISPLKSQTAGQSKNVSKTEEMNQNGQAECSAKNGLPSIAVAPASSEPSQTESKGATAAVAPAVEPLPQSIRQAFAELTGRTLGQPHQDDHIVVSAPKTMKLEVANEPESADTLDASSDKKMSSFKTATMPTSTGSSTALSSTGSSHRGSTASVCPVPLNNAHLLYRLVGRHSWG